MSRSAVLFGHRARCVTVMVAAAGLLSMGIAADAHAQAVITVDTTSDVVDFGGDQTAADLPGPDGQVSLREATIASTNSAGADTIGFDIPTSDPGFDGTGFVIAIASTSYDDGLTLGDDGTTLDGTTQPGGHEITVQGTYQPGGGRNDRGLLITSSANTVRGLTWRSFGNGIQSRGADNLITDVTVIAGGGGVSFFGDATPGDVLGGNMLTDSTVADNDGTAVHFLRSPDGVISGNTLTGNGGAGVNLNDSGGTVSDNLISGNATGVQVPSFGDGRRGVITGNTITDNAGESHIGAGVQIDTAGFTISRNAISANDELGINLRAPREDEFGVTRNDNGGAPNYPEHLTAVGDAAATVVEGRITDYTSPTSVPIELFVNDAADPSGHGEGMTYLATVTADEKGRFTATLPGGLAGGYITATATRSDGTTSEFSEAVPVEAPRGNNGKGNH